MCAAVGPTCAPPATLVVCMQDAQQCFYQASSSPCTNGACSGAAGAASCCTNTCTAGAVQCLSGKSLQTCTVAASGCASLTTTACASGTVCERRAPAACEDPNWAAWPMPNAATEVNAASYKDNGDGTVTDLVTALMWQKAPGTDTYIWSAAVTHCPQLTLGAHGDWRLPTFIELMSLVDFSAGSPVVNTTYFPAMSGGLYWTATTVSGQNNFAWEVNFNTGTGNADATTSTNPVICVR
jgi:hypothetical protein